MWNKMFEWDMTASVTGTDVKPIKFKYKWKVGFKSEKEIKSSQVFTITQGMIV